MPLQGRAMPSKHLVLASLARLVVNAPCHISRAIRHEVAVYCCAGHCIISSMAAPFPAANPSSVSRLQVPARTYIDGHRNIETGALAVLCHL
jgi:hypothetical protein